MIVGDETVKSHSYGVGFGGAFAAVFMRNNAWRYHCIPYDIRLYTIYCNFCIPCISSTSCLVVAHRTSSILTFLRIQIT